LKLQVFRGWWIVSSGAVIQMLLAGLIYQLYGAYVVLIQEEFGWTMTALSAVYALFRVESGLLGPPQGWLLDRYGPRPVMRIGMLFLGVGFIALSQIAHLGTFLFCFILIAIGGSFAGYISICVTIVNWFHRKRALAISVATMGYAVGGFVVPLAVLILERWGWRATAFSTGIVFLTAGLLLTQLFWARPEDCGTSIDGVPEDVVTAVEDGPQITFREAMTSRAFWSVNLGHTSALVIVSAISVHLIPHLIESLDFTLQEAGFAVMAMTAMQFVGLALGGYIGDHADKRGIAIVCMFMHGAGLLFLAFAASWWAVWAFAVLHGLAWGGRGPLMQALRADYFGRRSYGIIAGYSSLVVTLGTSGGPILAGVLFDRFGDYRHAFAWIAVFSLIGAAMFAMAKPPTSRRRLGRAGHGR
jgi:MFS family permease